MKVGDNMFTFLFNRRPIMHYKEWVCDLKYDAKMHRYYIDSYIFTNKYAATYSMFVLDSDSIVFLCKLLARFRSLRHQQ